MTGRDIVCNFIDVRMLTRKDLECLAKAIDDEIARVREEATRAREEVADALSKSWRFRLK
jgi:hypothetical protein